jgi:hypothetical protein
MMSREGRPVAVSRGGVAVAAASAGPRHPLVGPCAYLAEDQADRGAVVGVPHPVVDRREVEVRLADELGLELLVLQLDDDEAAQAEVVEEQVDVEIPPADLHVDLLTDEGEADAQLQQEVAEPGDQAVFQFALADGGHHRQEPHAIRSLNAC